MGEYCANDKKLKNAIAKIDSEGVLLFGMGNFIIFLEEGPV